MRTMSFDTETPVLLAERTNQMRMTFLAGVVVTLLALPASVATAQNVSDSTGPQVSAVTFSTSAVDTTAGSQNVTATVSATDDLSGVNYIYLYLQTTSSSQPNNARSTSCYVGNLQSGTRTNGVFTGTCTFPQYSQSGTWYVYQAYAYDNVGNYRSYYDGGAQLSFANQTISVTSASSPATAPPTLVSLAVNPGAVDTSTSSQTITLTAHITSNGDFNYAFVYLYDPTFQQLAYGYFYQSTRISGDAYDGTYQTTFTLPRYSHAANWEWNYAGLYNNDLHYSQYYTATNGRFTTLVTYNGATYTTTDLGTSGPALTPQNLVVTSNPSDSTGPTLVYFQLNPPSIDVATQSATVTVTVSVTDDLSGFNYGYVYFVSPNGQQTRGTSFSSFSGNGTIVFPQYSEAGNWQLSYMYLFDNVGNYTYITSSNLSSQGFPSSIQISSGLTVQDASGTVGGTVTLHAVLTYLGAPSTGKMIAFALQGNPVGTAVTDNTGTATLTNVSIASIPVGTYVNSIDATFAGDGPQAAASGQGTLIVTNKLSQTITFDPVADHPLTDSPISVSASASSGLPVAFAAVGSCTVSGNMVTLTAAGSCQIVASQSGNDTYNPAQVVSRTFTISKGNQTITFGPLSNRVYLDPAFTVSATASSGLPVSFALGVESTGCSLSGDTVTITGATGTGQLCRIVASQGGDGSYNAAPSVTQSFTIAKAAQTIAFNALPNRTYGEPPFGVTATAPGGTVSFALGAGSAGCSINAGTVTITGVTGAGQSCNIVASQGGNANYSPASNVTQSFTIAPATQVITFNALPNRTYGDPAFGLTATAPGGTVTFALGAGSKGCSISASTITITSATDVGESCIIVASQAGGGNYSAAQDVSRSFTIGKAGSTVTLTCPGTPQTFTGSAITPCTASYAGVGGLSGLLTPTYANNMNVGTASASATYAGDANHIGSDSAASFEIGKAGSTVTVTCPGTAQTFTGSAIMPCTASYAGPGGLTGSLTPTYANNVNAGTASASATYAGDANHSGSNNSASFEIGKAGSMVTVTCPGTAQTFTGSAIVPCTASYAGAGGLTGSLTPTYANNVYVGSASASATYAGDANHTGNSNSANFSIVKASSAVTVTFESGPYVYRGSPFIATAVVTGTGGLSGPVNVTYSGNCLHVTGTNGCTATAAYLGDSNHNASSDTKSITITKKPLTIAAVSVSKQYSDPMPVLTVQYSGFAGTDTPASLGGTLIWATSATTMSAPGTYLIAPSGLTSSDYAIAYANGTLVVTQEDARAFYTGGALFFASSSTAATATVTLTATIKDISAVDPTLSLPNPDNASGNISSAKISFVDRATGKALSNCANLTPSLVSAIDLTTGTVVCQTALAISNSGGSAYEIGIRIGTDDMAKSVGNYARDHGDDDTTITVALPLTSNFMTGGGYLVNPVSTTGSYAGDANRRTNFGFNVKYNKSGTNLQGNVNIIDRKGSKVYQFKGTSLVSLSVQYWDTTKNGGSGGWAALPGGACANNYNATPQCPIAATFESKANLNDVTLPTAVSLRGNLTLQMALTDKGEPGSYDMLAITVWDGSTLLLSSQWDGTKTVQKPLDGGNMVIH